MRPSTLAQTADRIQAGETVERMLAEFLDEFYLADLNARTRMLADRPTSLDDAKLDGLLGAVAEYLANQHNLPRVPAWAFEPQRYLEKAWHASPFMDDGAREYLTFASPAEFASRNIFTEEQPLRRARSRVLTFERTS